MLRRAFTFVEMLISVGIVTLIAGGVIVAMTRGASNVHRGSFNALAANQASWIVAIMRNDIARSDLSRITFTPDSGATWKGTSTFKVIVDSSKHVTYSVEARKAGKVFARHESGGRKQFLASEYLNDISVELKDGCFTIAMLLKDPGQQAVDFNWSARIYVPAPVGMDQFWKPFSSITK